MEKIKKFVKQKGTFKKTAAIVGLLIAVWANFVVYYLATGSSFSFAKAQNAVKISGTVEPTSPVEKVIKVEAKTDQASLADYRTSDYRLMVAIPNPGQNENASGGPQPQAVVKKSIVTFRGKSIYPNSEIFLVIRSNAIFTSVMSDSQGDWSWTNMGNPLENGLHSIEASNISPYDMSGKRDMFFQKYSFTVEANENSGGIEELLLENLSVVTVDPVSGDAGERFRKKELDNTYLFDISLINKKEYAPGDEMNLAMTFNPLGNISNDNAKINYEVYNNIMGGPFDGVPVYSFADDVSLSQNSAYLKRIKLKNDVQVGDYFIKVSAIIGGDTYVQVVKFSINPKTIIQVGATKIDENKLSMMVVWNMGLILGLAVIILVLMVFEYKQLSVCDLVDEDELKRKHYFSS